MRKKLLAALLCAAMTASLLIGCGSNEGTSGDNGGSSSEESEGALNIAIVSSPNGVDDGSFNEDNYNGILAYIEEHPDAKVTPIRSSGYCS